MSEEIEALLEAHELIVVEREDARHEFGEKDKFTQGHLNGLSEARNRIEQAIIERVDND